MHTIRKKIAYFSPILTLLLLATACRKPVGFEYQRVENIHLENILSTSPLVKMDIVYFNPNSFGVNLKKIDCDIAINNINAGKFALDTLMHIPGRATFALPVSFRLQAGNFFQNPLSLLRSEFTFSAKGFTKVGKGGVYINVPVDYTGKLKL